MTLNFDIGKLSSNSQTFFIMNKLKKKQSRLLDIFLSIN